MRKANPSQFQGVQFLRGAHFHVAEHGTSTDELLNPAYWAHITGRINVRDHIEVMPEGNSWFMELIVVAKDAISVQVKVLQFHDLDATYNAAQNAAAGALAEFYVRYSGPKTKFRVQRRLDNEVAQDGFETKAMAEQWIKDNTAKAT